MTADREPTRHISCGELAELNATARSRGTYPRHEPGRYLEADAIANRARESADRLRLAFLVVALLVFLGLVVAFGVLR